MIFAVVCLFVAVVHCADLVGRVRVPASDSCDTVVRLRSDRGDRVSVPLASGAFVFADVPVGSYVLTVQSVKFAFGDVRIDVGAGADARASTLKARALDDADGKLLALPLDLAPSNVYVYYQEAPTFRVTSILFHPMILMMLVMGGMSFLLPKMVDKDAMKDLTNAANSQIDAADSSDVASSAAAADKPVEEAPAILLPRLTAGQQVLLNKPPPKK
jgi:hypothetical protein